MPNNSAHNPVCLAPERLVNGQDGARNAGLLSQPYIALSRLYKIGFIIGIHPIQYAKDSSAKNLDDYFVLLAEEGLHRRYKKITKNIQDRFDYEIGIINSMGRQLFNLNVMIKKSKKSLLQLKTSISFLSLEKLMSEYMLS